MAKTTPAPLTEIETEACSRCGGSGHYSYCTMYGTRCFKCGGSGKTYTKRGAVAAAFLKEIRSKRVEDLKVGDEIHDAGNGITTGAGWGKVEKIGGLESYTFKIDGVEQTRRGITIETTRGIYQHWDPSSLFRVRQGAEAAETTRIRAIAFQDTLTKAGTPRKGGRS